MCWSPTPWIYIAVLICGLGYGGQCQPAQPESDRHSSSALLGPVECLDGPSYWCQNFTTAKHCDANQHCIRTVWEHQVLPPDNGEICETCKKMVQQARDELKSNETQENLKLVLEGSCMILIPFKPLAHECVKMIDNVIPQLIEAISSQMNPQMVCATAGLCNSPRIDKMLAQYKENSNLNCESCTVVAGMAESNFRNAGRDNVLNAMLEVCRKMSSFSDSCAATVIVHFSNLYESLAANLHPEGVCHLAGVCHQKYHSHDKKVEEKPLPKLEGDMPCELCEQLVQHLKDVLVANTTEKEFEQVLLGICSQTQGFKKECVDLVETYYPAIYSFLTTELDGKTVCAQIGICPKTSSFVAPLYPLLPVNVAQSLEKTSSGLHRVPLTKSGVSVHSLSAAQAQLPLDTLILSPNDKELCQMCEYFLHFLQTELTDPDNEQEIIKKAEKACNGLPSKFAPSCHQFVETYAPAVLALLAQDIDPSQVCPKIGVCPGFYSHQVTCEHCKVTTIHLLSRVGDNKTEANILNELRTLCLVLPYEESRACSRMMVSHHEDLADMVTAEFTEDEMCVFMKYCSVTSESAHTPIGGDLETNEIIAAVEVGNSNENLCEICEFTMKILEDKLQNNKTEDEIRRVVEHICYVMPKTVRPKCIKFIDQYSELIITLLAQSVDPKLICQQIGVCPQINLDYVQRSISKCVVCESLMGAMEGVLEDPSLKRDFNHQLEMACSSLPQAMRRECREVVRQLAPQIEDILETLPVGPMVCRKLQLCGHSQTVDFVGTEKCSQGQTYWCLSTVHAATCQKIEHCQKNVWLADKPNRKPKVHTKKFIF